MSLTCRAECIVLRFIVNPFLSPLFRKFFDSFYISSSGEYTRYSQERKEEKFEEFPSDKRVYICYFESKILFVKDLDHTI